MPLKHTSVLLHSQLLSECPLHVRETIWVHKNTLCKVHPFIFIESGSKNIFDTVHGKIERNHVRSVLLEKAKRLLVYHLRSETELVGRHDSCCTRLDRN